MLNTLWFIGVLSYYALSPTVGMINYHQNLGNIPQGDIQNEYILVAVNDCGLIGEVGTITVGGVVQDKPVLVYDCLGNNAEWEWMSASNADTPWLVSAEVDYWTFKEHPNWFYNGTIAVLEFKK